MTMTVSELVSGLDAEFRRLGYRDSTLVWYRGCGRRLEKFFAARGVEDNPTPSMWRWLGSTRLAAASSRRSRPPR